MLVLSQFFHPRARRTDVDSSDNILVPKDAGSRQVLCTGHYRGRNGGFVADKPVLAPDIKI